MKTSWKTACLYGVLLMGSILSACSTSGMHADHPTQHTTGVKTILILPFVNVSVLYEQNVHVRCYLCGQVMATGYVPDSAGPFLTSELIFQMEKNENFTFLSSEGSADLITGMMSGPDNAEDRYRNLYMQAGKRAGADAVLIGHIFRFNERKGNRASVESPASVAYDLHLIDVETGRILWSASFDETQRPLTDNILEIGTFMKRGASWVTAEELAQGGLETMLQRFPQP